MAKRIASLSHESGIEVILAGRASARLIAAARSLNVPWRESGSADPEDLDAMLTDVKIVLNTAGPFVRTAAGLMRACIRNGCHYLDLSNEATTFEDAWSLDNNARQAGVTLVPGAGFGTAAAEALASHLLARIEEPDGLMIVRSSSGGIKTEGVSRTMWEILGQPNAGNKGSRRSARGRRIVGFDLPDGRRTAVPVALGDAFAVARTTGIEQVTAYSTTRMNLLLAQLTIPLIRRLARTGWGGPRSSPRKGRKPRGTDVECTQIWIRATNPRGESVTSYLKGGSGSELAARIAVQAIEQLRNRPSPGVVTSGELVGTGNLRTLPGLQIADT